MSFSDVADVRLEGGGVMFQYLLLQLERAAEKRTIVRGLNYQPYAGKIEEQIVKSAREELGENGFFEDGGDLQIAGGGSVAFNLYYENITLFGSNPTYGMEENREAVAKMIEKAYPEHEVSWYGPEPPESDSEEE
jgi:hypothetical protein